MDIKQIFPKGKVASAAPLYEFTENDQTFPAGMWRWRVNGDTMLLERALSTSWASDRDTIAVASDGTVTLSGGYGLLDDQHLTLGTTLDQVMLNRSTLLGANTALTAVLIGTPVSQAIAANSLMISNITASGDIALYVNKAGASQMAFLADGSTGDTAILAASGQSVDVYIAGTKEIDYATAAFAFQQASTLSTTTGVLTLDGDDGIVLQTTGSGSVQVKEILVLGTGEGIVGAKTGNVFRAPDHPGGTDTDLAGADITIAAGLGTGDGDAGTIIFQLPEVVGSGTTVQTRATVLTLDMAASTTELSFTFTPNTTITSSGVLTLGAHALSGELDAAANSIGFTQQTATGDGTTTIDWRLGNKFYFTFGAANETFTFTAPTKPGNFILVMKQDGVGSRTATWPGTVLWPGGVAPTLSVGVADVDIISFYYDGTNYFGTYSLDFS